MNASDDGTCRLAELVGIILGDGSINVYPSVSYSTFYRLKISFHSEETDYIRYVRTLVEDVLHVQPQLAFRKNERTAELLIFQKSVVEQLLLLGLRTSPKWERAIVPGRFMTPDLGRYILKGYLDTDGSVVLANNNGTSYPRLEMKISPSPMQQQLLVLIGRLNIVHGVYQIGKGKVRVQMNGVKNLKQWMRLVGTSNPKHVRKVRASLEGHPFRNAGYEGEHSHTESVI
jgi:hypothetical protein